MPIAHAPFANTESGSGNEYLGSLNYPRTGLFTASCSPVGRGKKEGPLEDIAGHVLVYYTYFPP
jgi:hypothetical protein